MEGNSNQITIYVYPSRKIEKLYARNQSSKPTKKTKLLNIWGTNFINQKSENLTKS